MTAAPLSDPPSGDTADHAPHRAIPLADALEKDVALRRTRRRVLRRNLLHITAVATAVALMLAALVGIVRWAP